MPLPAWLRRFKDGTRHLRRLPTTLRSRLVNRWSHRPVAIPGGPVVSLTTHGPRLEYVHLAIESICAGSLRPGRLILWLNPPVEMALLPVPLQRLQARGLEVRVVPNNGPHTKYFPYVVSAALSSSPPLVTADDDMLYPRDWLAGLAAAHAGQPAHIHCWRAKVMKVDARGIRPFRDWPYCTSTEPSLLHHAEGVCGVIYPSAFLVELKAAGDAFRDCCPRADDLWLHVNALRAGRPVQQIEPRQRSFPSVPGTEVFGLMHDNLGGTGNDVQIKATYSADDVNRLRAARAAPALDGAGIKP